MINNQALVKITWGNANKAKYIKKGYIFTKNGDAFYAKVSDVLEISSGVKIPVFCDYCGDVYYPTSKNYKDRHNRNEKDCCEKCKGKKIKSTIERKYGYSNVAKVPEVKEKIRKTCLERYGANSPLENKEIFDKTLYSLNSKFNIKNGIKDFRKVESIDKKIKETNIEKYGGISPFSSEEIQIKSKNSLYKNGTCPTSKNQNLLYSILKNKYEICKLNFPCGKCSLDCAVFINNIKIDVEYDGWYWHQDLQKDRRRDNFVKSKGYKILRILSYNDRLPTEAEIFNAIKTLYSTERSYIKIEVK